MEARITGDQKRFEYLNELQIRLFEHEKKWKKKQHYKCSSCGKVFCQEDSLKKHTTDVHEEKKRSNLKEKEV